MNTLFKNLANVVLHGPSAIGYIIELLNLIHELQKSGVGPLSLTHAASEVAMICAKLELVSIPVEHIQALQNDILQIIKDAGAKK